MNKHVYNFSVNLPKIYTIYMDETNESNYIFEQHEIRVGPKFKNTCLSGKAHPNIYNG